MKTPFYQNIGILILINLLIKPLYIFGIEAEVQNQVGDQEYGLYFAIFNFLFIFQWVLDPGIQNYNSQSLSKDRSQLSTLLYDTIAAKTITAIVYVIIIGLITCIFYGWHLLPVIGLMLVTMVLTSFTVFLRSHFSAMGHYIKDSILSSVDKLLLIIVLGYVLYYSGEVMSILKFVQIQCATMLMSFVIVAMLFMRQFGRIPLRVNVKRIQQLIKQSFPFALIFILMSLYNRMDGVMLKFLVDDDSLSAGIYATGFRIYDAMNMIGYLFATLLLPMFSYAMRSQDRLKLLYDESLRLMLVIAVLASIGTYLFSADILSLFYDHVDDRHIAVFRILSLSFFTVALTYIYSTLMTASAKLKVFNILLACGVVVNFGLNLYLIPTLQAEGAAIATLITQSMLLIGQIILVFSTFDFKINYMMIVQVISMIAVTYLSYVIAKAYLPIHFIFQGLVGVIISLAYILALKFLRLDVIKLKKQ